MNIMPSILLPLLIVAPGVICLVWQRRRVPRPLTLDDLILAALATVVATSGVSIILLELSAFRLPYILVGLAAVAVLLLSLALHTGRAPMAASLPGRVEPSASSQEAGLESASRPAAPLRVRRPGLVTWLLVLVLVVGLFLRLPPAYYAYGGQDPGVYLSISEHFVRHGRIVLHDPLIEQAFSDHGSEAEALQAVFRPKATGEQREAIERCQTLTGYSPRGPVPGHAEGSRLPGFYIGDASRGLLVPQFLHLHPLWLALANMITGARASVAVVTLFSLLSLTIIFLLSRRVLGDGRAALFATAFLAVNILQVWTNRFPVAETTAQALLFGGILLYYRSQDDDDPLAMWLSVACFGLYAFTRAISVLVLPAFVVAFWLAAGRRRDYVYYNAVFLAYLYAAAHAVHFSYPYLADLFALKGNFRIPAHWHTIVAAGLVGISAVNAVALLLQRWVRARLWPWIGRHRRLVAAVPAVYLLLWTTRSTITFFEQVAGRVTDAKVGDPWSPVTQLSWYVTLPGILLAAIGGYLLALDLLGPAQTTAPRQARHVLFLLLGFAAVGAGSVSAPVGGIQFYYARYYVAELLPFVMIALAYVLAIAWRHRLPVIRFGAIGAGLYLLACYSLPYATNPAYRVEEMRGSYDFVKAVANALPSDALVFVGCEETFPSHCFHVRYATPLMVSYDRYTMPHCDLATAVRAARPLLAGGREVIIISDATPLPPLLGDGDVLALLFARGGERTEHSKQMSRVPDITQFIEARWYAYRLELARGDARDAGGIRPSGSE